MLLRTAERLLIETILHVGNSTYRKAKLQEGIVSAVNFFLRATRAEIATTDVTMSASVATVDVTGTSGLSAFESGDFVEASINNYRVGMVPNATILRRHAAGLQTGRPGMISFRVNKTALFDKTTDQSYTLELTHIKIADFVPGSAGAYTSGTSYEQDECVTDSSVNYRSLVDTNSANTPASSPTKWEVLDSGVQTIVDPKTYVLPLPVKDANDVIHWGARGFAMLGLDGHPDAAPAMRHFTEFVVPEAVARYARGTQGVSDPSIARIHHPQLAAKGG